MSREVFGRELGPVGWGGPVDGKGSRIACQRARRTVMAVQAPNGEVTR